MTRLVTDDYKTLFLQDIPLIDTRAPVEYHRGAFPCATNLPLMIDEERRQVGIRYKQAGQQAAIELGGKLITAEIREQRIRKWSEFAREHPDGVLYCFRGGLRSRITQDWMMEAGVHYPYVKGGYKAMRRYLIESFDNNIAMTPLVLISGRTGTGKTILLHRLKRMIDLEGLANHRGSSFGGLLEAQPAPIDFENALSIELLKLCHKNTAPVFIEGEGRLIGRISLPSVLWNKMLDSPLVLLESTLKQRCEIAIRDYVASLLRNLERLYPRDRALQLLSEKHRDSLFRIRKRLGGDRYGKARDLLESAVKQHRDNGDLAAYIPFVRLLLKEYYDPMYDYQLSKRSAKVLFRGTAVEIEQWTLDYLSRFDVNPEHGKHPDISRTYAL